MRKFIVTAYFPKENRYAVSFYPDFETALLRLKMLQETFYCDVYISEVIKTEYRKQSNMEYI